MCSKGYTLLELMVVLAAISILSIIVLPFYRPLQDSVYTFVYDYLVMQAKTMASRKSSEFNKEYKLYHNYPIKLNEAGHINKAQTIIFDNHGRHHEMVIQLGGGRLVYKK